MSRNPVVDSVRILPRDTSFLDRKVGSKGEIFFDQTEKTLRLYDGIIAGGIALLKADLSNAQGVVGVGAELGSTAPATSDLQSGAIWFNTSTNSLSVLVSGVWTSTSPGAIDNLSDVSISSPSAGQVLKYNGTTWVNGTDNLGGDGGGATILDDLTDVAISSPSNGQVLKYNGTTWVNGTDNSGSSSEVTSIVAGPGISINPTNGKGDVTITATGVQEFANLTDSISADLTIDKIAYQAITRFPVTPNGATAYLFGDQYPGNNPTIYAISGTTIAFNLEVSGHPFLIQDGTGTNYSLGLVHVTTAGVISTGVSAQGQRTGTLYWQIPKTTSGNFRYQCSLHPVMVGSIVIKDIAAI